MTRRPHVIGTPMDMAEAESDRMHLYGHVTERDVLEVFAEWHQDVIHCEHFTNDGEHTCALPKITNIMHGYGRWTPDTTGEYCMQFRPCDKGCGAFAYSEVDLEEP